MDYNNNGNNERIFCQTVVTVVIKNPFRVAVSCRITDKQWGTIADVSFVFDDGVKFARISSPHNYLPSAEVIRLAFLRIAPYCAGLLPDYHLTQKEEKDALKEIITKIFPSCGEVLSIITSYQL